MSTRLVQIRNGSSRRVAVVEEPRVRLLATFSTAYDLAQMAVSSKKSLLALVKQDAGEETLDYNSLYLGDASWQLMLPFDHPQESARCLVSGTGLTHLGSAKNRQAMHGANEAELTDSMRMFRLGVEGGRPAPGCIGTAPEWFYKGPGSILRAHGETLSLPAFANDGGEEAEIAGIYLIDTEGEPRQIGMAIGNEFSDHRFEKKNYLNLAGSKLRTCGLGPELILDPEFRSVSGRVSIERKGAILWTKEIKTGEEEMCHSLQNIEHHHFKFEAHRRPGDVHVHYFGAHSLSFGDGLQLVDGDVMSVAFEGFGRALRNSVKAAILPDSLISTLPLA